MTNTMRSTDSLAPPGWKPLPRRAGDYLARHPTRYDWRSDVEALARRLYRRFPSGAIHVNTYVDHPEGWGRDRTSFDVWGPKGRGHPINPQVGRQVFTFIFDDPNPPWIDWCIWQRWIWTRAKGVWEPFGADPFMWHDNHPHFTFR